MEKLEWFLMQSGQKQFFLFLVCIVVALLIYVVKAFVFEKDAFYFFGLKKSTVFHKKEL